MPESRPDSRGILLSTAQSAVFVEGELTLGSEISSLGRQRTAWDRGSNRQFSVWSYCPDPKCSPESILGFFLWDLPRWGRCSSASLMKCGLESWQSLTEKAILRKSQFEFERQGKHELTAKVKKNNQVSLPQDYQTPIHHPGWSVVCQKANLAPAHTGYWPWPLPAPFKRSKSQLIQAGRAGEGHTPALCSPTESFCHFPTPWNATQESPNSWWTLPIPTALKLSKNTAVSIQILKYFFYYFNSFFSSLQGMF